MPAQHWLMKTEPDTFSIRDLRKRPRRTEGWDGVRNYQARNHLRSMRAGDMALFYHSSTKTPGVAGRVLITRAAYPDPSALDPRSPYFDSRANPERNPWVMVDVALEEEYPRLVSLAEMRATSGLENMVLLKKGSRLSIQPVTPEEFAIIEGLARK